MDKKRLTLEIGLGVLVVILGIALFVTTREKVSMSGQPDGGGSAATTGGKLPESRTRSAVPQGTSVPEVGGSGLSGNTVPIVVRPSGPGTDSKIREFRIKMDKNTFTPNAVAVYQNDVVHIDFDAIDKTYDVVQPDHSLGITVAKGKTGLLEGQFTQPGKYAFYCNLCGGLEKGPVGYITVVPK